MTVEFSHMNFSSHFILLLNICDLNIIFTWLFSWLQLRGNYIRLFLLACVTIEVTIQMMTV